MSLFALNGAKVREADAAVGVRHISLDCSPEGEQRLRSAMPGYCVQRVKRGEAAAVVDDVCVLAHDIHIITGKHVADAVVEARSGATWERIDQLAPLHPTFRDWTRERLARARRDHSLPSGCRAVLPRARASGRPSWTEAQQRLLWSSQ